MTNTASDPIVGVVGRERELAELHAFLTAGGERCALVLEAPGIGKTTLWEAGVEAARRGGARVLSARPTAAEARTPGPPRS